MDDGWSAKRTLLIALALLGAGCQSAPADSAANASAVTGDNGEECGYGWNWFASGKADCNQGLQPLMFNVYGDRQSCVCVPTICRVRATIHDEQGLPIVDNSLTTFSMTAMYWGDWPYEYPNQDGTIDLGQQACVTTENQSFKMQFGPPPHSDGTPYEWYGTIVNAYDKNGNTVTVSYGRGLDILMSSDVDLDITLSLRDPNANDGPPTTDPQCLDGTC